MRIALESLSSCLGCQLVFLSLEDFFFTFIGENDVSYAPFLMDQVEPPEVELALVEGTVKNADQYRRAKRIRERAERLVALGTCACYGGVQGLANRFEHKAVMRRRYGGGHSFDGEPQGMGRLQPLDSYVGVDAFLPGCPPPAPLLKSFLELTLSSGSLPTREGLTVCSECAVSSPPVPGPGPRRITGSAPAEGLCILEQGYVCMGPLTRGGCGAECGTEKGIPCLGCRGPSETALLSPAQDPRLVTLRRLARASGRRREEVSSFVKDPAHTCFMFCLGEPLLRRRRPGGTAGFVRRLDEK